ncbi:AMP-binding protein [Actinosynnema sp. NPDC091369]
MTNTIGERAVLHGGPLSELPVPTLADALLRAARLDDAGRIVHLDGGAPQERSYADLWHDAARVLTGLRGAGVRPGDRVVLRVDGEPDLLTAFWACQLGGFVPAPVTAHPPAGSALSADELLSAVWHLLDEPWVIASGRPGGAGVPAARWLGEVGDLRAEDPVVEIRTAAVDDLAALLLTSGSTGLPKAVALTHRNVLSRAHATALVRGLSRRNRTFNWMPLDHVGGLVMFHVRDVVLGCHQVHATTRWVLDDPLRWLDAVDEHRCDTTWAPNFAFGLVVDRADAIERRSWDLRRLGYVMNGGEPVKPRVARRFLELLAPFGLPSTAMHPGWGMSETSAGVVDRVFSPLDGSDDDRFVPVGAPHPGVSLRVVGADGHVLGEGETGRLHVSGAPVTAGYYGDDRQNLQSFTDDGWFKTGDLAFISDGELTVTGRVDDLIEVGDTTCYGHEIEAAVEELPFVEPSYTVAFGIGGALEVAFHPRSGKSSDAEHWRIVQHVSQRFGVAVGRVHPVPKDAVPKTGIGKLKRAQLIAAIARSATEHRGFGNA